MIDDLLNKLADKEQKILSQKIFAPYIKGGNSIILRIDKVIYKLKTPKFKKDGFGVFRANTPNTAKRLREAERYEIEDYLLLLPKVDFILVWKSDRWLACPSNANSFKQQFGMDPRLVNILVADNVEMLDTIEARFDGSNFWFDCIKFGGDVERKEMLRQRIENQQYQVDKNITSGLTPEEIAAFRYTAAFHEEANRPEFEKRLEMELEKVDASMDKCIERGDNVEVQWRDKKTSGKYTSVLRKDDLSVVTAGICLSGGDKKFDLQSLVTVCRQGANRGHVVHVGRGGMGERGYWDMYGDGDEYDYYDE